MFSDLYLITVLLSIIQRLCGIVASAAHLLLWLIYSCICVNNLAERRTKTSYNASTQKEESSQQTFIGFQIVHLNGLISANMACLKISQ